MQIAEQAFGIETAANACIRLADGEPSYICRTKLDSRSISSPRMSFQKVY